MRRLIISAFLCSTLLAVGCGDDNKAGGDGSDTGDTGKTDTGKLPDGGKKPDAGKLPDGGKLPGSDGGTTMMVTTGNAEKWVQDSTPAAGLSDDDLNKLKAGGDCTATILYPYDKTTFPAGLVPPTIMWDGPTDGSYIHMTFNGTDVLDYQAAGGPAPNGILTIDADDWNNVVERTGSLNTTLQVTLNTMTGGAVSSCTQTWTIAPGVMSGSVFFNTYNHPDKLGNGAVVRLTLGQPMSEIYLSYNGLPSIAGPCISCHSVSTNGQMMAASLHNYTPAMQSYQAASYPVQTADEPSQITALPDSTFGAFTPDGKFLLSMGNPDCTNGADAFPRSANNFPLVPGPSVATLHDTQTGSAVQVNGLNPSWFMWMPQFSPDGTKIAFNHAQIGPDGKTDRRQLAIMDYDETTQTFSNLKVVVKNQGPAPSVDYAPAGTLSQFAPAGVGNCAPSTSTPQGQIPGGACTGPCFPGWPFFTPDGQGLVYSLISQPDFASAIPGRDTPSQSELWYLDIQSGTTVRLDTAMKGLDKDDPQANYYPTMLPVQVGGYFWLFWTSTRDWGHHNLQATPQQVAANWFGGGSVLNATRKRIWVSGIKARAVTEAGQDTISDTSSPAFYLEGQTESGNVRAFATLNPCHKDGDSCQSGLDCCNGYCDYDQSTKTGVCVPMKMCSGENEKCTTDKDCCPPAAGEQPLNCIGNFCGHYSYL